MTSESIRHQLERQAAPVPTSERLALLSAGIRFGYQAGHNDTVEACYGSPEGTAEDYAHELLEELISDGAHERQAAPVPVTERPWERDGWCDEQGQCWMGDPGGGGFIPSWRLCRPEDAPRMRVSLPFNALPLPSGEVEHG